MGSNVLLKCFLIAGIVLMVLSIIQITKHNTVLSFDQYLAYADQGIVKPDYGNTRSSAEIINVPVNLDNFDKFNSSLTYFMATLNYPPPNADLIYKKKKEVQNWISSTQAPDGIIVYLNLDSGIGYTDPVGVGGWYAALVISCIFFSWFLSYCVYIIYNNIVNIKSQCGTDGNVNIHPIDNVEMVVSSTKTTQSVSINDDDKSKINMEMQICFID